MVHHECIPGIGVRIHVQHSTHSLSYSCNLFDTTVDGCMTSFIFGIILGIGLAHAIYSVHEWADDLDRWMQGE